MRFRLSICVIALLFAGSFSANAEIIYQVQTVLPYVYTPYEFTFSEPTFLTETTTIPGSSLNFLVALPLGCTITSAGLNGPSSSSPSIQETYSGCASYNGTASTGGFKGPLTSDGVYSNGAQIPSIITITGTPDVAATPEPASLGLLATGLLCAGGLMRRRFSAR